MLGVYLPSALRYNGDMSFLKRRTPLSARHAFIVLSTLMCFFSLQVSLTMYMDSSFLKERILATPSFANIPIWEHPDDMVGTIYTFSSLLSLLVLFAAPRILRRFGNYRWTISLLALQTMLLLGLALFNSAWLIIPLFVVEVALASILYFNFDIFLEHYSRNEETGIIRGVMKAVTSIAWLLPPFAAGYIVDRFGFGMIYLLGAALLTPTVFIMMRYMSDFKDMSYDEKPMWIPEKQLSQHPDIARIYHVNFFLQFFYAWMIIYAPIYFHEQLGISYADFGLMLSIALTAFIIFPYFEGWLADRVFGEKEMLLAGFFLMGIASFAIPYFADAGLGIWWWALLLFVGRMGAATVETMSEVYFFKQVNAGNASLIGYFRRARPLAWIVAPLSASLLLGFHVIEFGTLFTILGVVMLAALYFPLRLKDTR